MNKNNGAISAPLDCLVIPRILSLGAGVQSSTIAMMMKNGEIPKADLVVFADTGAEPRNVYQYLDWIDEHMNMPLLRVSTNGGLTEAIKRACSGEITRVSSPPLFTENGGMIFRQCTWDYKVRPIRKALRERGYTQVTMIRGISFEERQRAKASDVKWITHEHPLVDIGMTRIDCKRWMSKHGYPIPPRSACVYCPYRCNTEWQKMRDLAPEDWQEACRMDELMRNNMPHMKEKVFVHRSLMALRKAPIEDNQMDLFDDGWADCEGLCGV
jgi:hypothetical protein